MLSIDLLLKEIQDRYIQENFKRIKIELDRLGNSVDSDDIINNIVNVIGNNAWEKKADEVLASATKTVDTVNFTNMVSLKYVISLYNSSENKYRSFEMTVGKKSGNVVDTVSNKLGDNINYAVNAVLVGSNVEIQIQNNETYKLDVSIGKLAL